LLDSKKPSKEFASEIASFLQLTDVTRSGFLATAVAYLRGLRGPGIVKMFERTTFDLKQFATGERPATIYVSIPFEKLVSHNRISKLIFGALFMALFALGTPRRRTLIQLDEASSLGSFEPLRTLLTLMRGQGVIAHTLWQDLNQLNLNYVDSATILNNHHVIRFLGGVNSRQIVEIADVFGVSPRRLTSLELDEQALLINGQFHVAKRLNYLKDKLFQGRFAPNLRHYSPQCGEILGLCE